MLLINIFLLLYRGVCTKMLLINAACILRIYPAIAYAAEETGKFVIGCDSNQNYLKPGHVLTSMLKRLDVATFELIRRTRDGAFQSGNLIFGLANGGMDVAIDKFNGDLLTEEQWQAVAQVKQSIIDGTIDVPDYYDTLR